MGTELTDIDVEMEEHYSLSLPSLSPVHISESFLHTDDNTQWVLLIYTHIDHIFSRDGSGGGAQEDAADLHAVPDPGAGEGDIVTIIHIHTLAPGSVAWWPVLGQDTTFIVASHGGSIATYKVLKFIILISVQLAHSLI